MDYWERRWATNQTGWHRQNFNDLLTKHWPNINAPVKGKVLIPLCGKSLDMLWFADIGYNVTGIELAPTAIKEFFADNDMIPECIDRGNYNEFSSGSFTILNGNVLDFKPGLIMADAWYDRAAMIALPPQQREKYIRQIAQQTKSGAVGLLITYTYPQNEMTGPPFSLEDKDVRILFSHGFEVEQLERIELEDEKGRGLSSISSSVFKITKK